MSSQSPSTPLRDRVLANVHIDDANPWVQSATSSGSQSSAISPLRITKRDTPGRKAVATAIARRSSSSYNHMRNNNLVSKSPFRSHIPTPPKATYPRPPIQIPRKVSGEKRPRPSSMNEQAENEHPTGFKRRQSKGLQGLYQKEPVTKSPFRRTPDRETTPEPPLPPPPRIDRQSTASPTRPSLVTKRFHGPRMAGFNPSATRHARRKTVTFDERCDVVEFDREEHELEDEEEEGYHTPRDGEDDEGGQVDPDLENEPEHGTDHDGVEHDFGGSNGEDSITGLMDSLIHDTQLGDIPCTPPHDSNFPEDLETEDGVPLGRTHHADRQAAYHERLAREDHLNLDIPPPERSYIWSSASSSPVTPQVARIPPSTGVSTDSGLPLDRTTHPESFATSHRRGEVDKDVQMLPPSPSPSKVSAKPESRYQEELIPSSDLPVPRRKSIPGALDPFDESPIKGDYRQLTPVDADILPERGSDPEVEPDPVVDDEPLEPPPRLADTSITSIATPSGSPIPGSPVLPSISSRHASDAVRSRSGSPLSRSASPFFMNKNSSSASVESVTSLSGRSSRSPRISREDLHQRLVKKRSTDSPLREVDVSDAGSRHTNVYTIAPEPTEEVEADVAPLNTSMFSRKSSVEPSTDLSTDMDLREVAEEHIEKKIVASAKQHSAESAFAEAPRHDLLAIEDILPADLGFGSNGGELGDMRSALDRLVRDVAESSSGVHNPQTSNKLPFVPGSVKVEAMTEGIQAGMFQIPPTPVDDVYGDTSEGDEDEDLDEPVFPPPLSGSSTNEMRLEVSHDPTPLLGTGFGDFSASFGEGEGSATEHQQTPPPPPPKIGIKEREEMIKAKRREIRRLEEEQEIRYAPPTLEGGRPSRRRSKSAGDAADLSSGKQRTTKDALGMDDLENGDDPLSESINRELQKLEIPRRPQKQKYHVKERETMIIASSDADQVHHMSSAGDVNSGKAWRALRRPSDMNEYSKQIKELRAQERTGKAHGKLFVKVMGVKSLDVPLPPQPTSMSCTLNNGIHYVTTPECELAADTKIEQEFELIEHSKLEFTLSFKVKRDPHIVTQMKAVLQPVRQPPPPAREVTPPPTTKSRFNFFGSPKKTAKHSPRPSPAPAPAMPPRIQENLARYLKPDGSLARAFIAYKDVAAHCDTRLFETAIPLIGQRIDAEGTGTTMTTLPVGELALQLFRLPPLHGVPTTELPQSLDECLRGLRHVSWHKVTYFEGTLTQNGGDCMTWKRRHFRIIGANMVAFNDVTKRAITTINLKKAVGLHDDQEKSVKTPASHASSNSYDDEFDGPCGVEKSFKLLFPGNQRISFFADTEADKAKWLEILGALVGRIPPNPLWAELLWQKQQETMAKEPA